MEVAGKEYSEDLCFGEELRRMYFGVYAPYSTKRFLSCTDYPPPTMGKGRRELSLLLASWQLPKP